jgi:hypothetical protein
MRSKPASVGLFILVVSLIALMFLLPNAEINQEDPSKKILGTWRSESDQKSHLVFLGDGVLKTLYDGEELYESTWEFVEECNGERSSDKDYGMLKITYVDDGIYDCYVVQGLESVLTLLRVPEGDLLLFNRVVE